MAADPPGVYEPVPFRVNTGDDLPFSLARFAKSWETRCPMSEPRTRGELEVEVVPLSLPLDRETVAWLLKISKGSDSAAAEIVADMLRAIREDDEDAHQVLH